MLEFLQDQPVLLAIAIFFARILDVSIGTMRTILVIRSHRIFAAVLGFFEVLIWLTAAAQVFGNLDTWYLAIMYAAGFATGNVVGMWIESRLALGSELVRAVSQNLDINLAERLRMKGYSVTELPGKGDDGQIVEVLLMVEKRKNVPALIAAITQSDPTAFWTISDIKSHPILPSLAHRVVAASEKYK